MITNLLIILGILFIITLVITLNIAKNHDRQIKEYESRGATPDEELERSRQYEQESLRRNIPNLVLIYIGLFILVFIAAIIILTFL
ncbi:putative membrane protein [Alkalibacillus filiformis]|uniref:Membrane protein n=1 Tax=Alkalibacillus filiformis TaxID=200990 RepID=A0ABU0DV02_9BACI|nr:hypothetical protein [Alkalibacillus filiformis]MDQ0351970.1 putative membrane protein [Alkalibacillus filiformis]